MPACIQQHTCMAGGRATCAKILALSTHLGAEARSTRRLVTVWLGPKAVARAGGGGGGARTRRGGDTYGDKGGGERAGGVGGMGGGLRIGGGDAGGFCMHEV